MHLVKAIERGVALWKLAFQDHCELCDAVQRVYGNAGEALVMPTMGHSLQGHPKLKLPLVAGLGKTLEERPEA